MSQSNEETSFVVFEAGSPICQRQEPPHGWWKAASSLVVIFKPRSIFVTGIPEQLRTDAAMAARSYQSLCLRVFVASAGQLRPGSSIRSSGSLWSRTSSSCGTRPRCCHSSRRLRLITCPCGSRLTPADSKFQLMRQLRRNI